MGTGILVCGLNGAGKSTLGKALAQTRHAAFIDSEDLYFPEAESGYIYALPRSCEEAEDRLLRAIKAHENFVFASVKGDYGDALYPFFQYVVWMEAPADVRVQRVKNRSFQRFGGRMLPGGDLYEQEEAFFQFVQHRAENTVEEWVRACRCPVIRIDGTKPVEDNIRRILEHIQS